MRDPQRIEEVLGMINQIWVKQPDLRFLQLIYNLQNEFSYKNKDVGKIESIEDDGFAKVGYDLFSIEDDRFIKYLTEKVAEIN
jgi:uncharacterized protein YihD (DUF1040 family)